MTIQLEFRTLIEDEPGPFWQALFERLWPAYRSWYLRRGVGDLPSYLSCRRAMREHMPELAGTWEQLVELAGGGDIESRFLSLWCPPPYITGCSQAVWVDRHGDAEPVLLRNYDFAPGLLEGNWLATRWNGQRVAALGDCIWGALDGINESGLSASLSFGGRTVSGTGFGIPLVMRYLLEVAHDTAEAVEILQRIPVSMCYTVTLLDAAGNWATVFVGPDRATQVTDQAVVTNYQDQVEWEQHAAATRAVERRERLQQQVDGPGSAEDVIEALLQEPLYQQKWLHGYGTLYGVAYRPRSGSIELFWPNQRWQQRLAAFEDGARLITYVGDSKATKTAD
ncbi:C45 family autoproteolytic acyltransferase/hydolase [Piscinibacter sakaiensis]|uniref:C45 family autoproteolytic acyltransferase/hydolase n=1 Tax=Piscinibacter sakaiensis TaxID=1547922 RepID=UPI003AACD67A